MTVCGIFGTYSSAAENSAAPCNPLIVFHHNSSDRYYVFTALDKGELKMLETGTKAPDFTLADKEGNKVSLSDFLGKKVVLYFYPKDNTPGCTRQACTLLDVKLISSLRTNRFQLENGINNTVSLFCQ